MKGISITFDMLMFVLEIIFLIFFSVLLWKAIASNINPDAQVVMFNTQLLSAKIEEACISGQSSITDFKFPQPQPSMLLNEFLPRLAIKSGGDPHYLLYYEMFPEGEGIGWELYQDFPNRVFAPFTYPGDPEEIPKADFEKELLNHIKNVDSLIEEHFNKYYNNDEKKEYIKNTERVVLVNNIMLSDYLNAIPTDWEKKSILNEEEGNAGKWEDSVFKFSNYRGLTQLEKSFLKYRPCGENTLCLKTRDGVYTFPLNCRGIEYIQLNYDARNRDAAWGTIIGASIGSIIAGIVIGPETILTTIGKFLFKAPLPITIGVAGLTAEATRRVAVWMSANFLLYKNSDFYVTSPCALNDVDIELGGCECKRMIRYPMYKYVLEDDNMFVKRIGYHYTCLEGKGDDFVDDYNNVKSIEEFGIQNKCIKITIKEKPNAFCWTPNPYKEGFWEWDSRKYAELVGKVFKSDPLAIKKNTAVFYNNGIKGLLIKPLKGITFLSKIIDIDWRWPSGFLVPS